MNVVRIIALSLLVAAGGSLAATKPTSSSSKKQPPPQAVPKPLVTAADKSSFTAEGLLAVDGRIIYRMTDFVVTR